MNPVNPSLPVQNPFGSDDSIEYLNFEEFNNLGNFDRFIVHFYCSPHPYPEEDSFNEFCASLQYDPFHPEAYETPFFCFLVLLF